MAWAELSDVRCYYEVLGHGDPLLLVPGLGLTCRTWEEVAPELAQHFSLILLDNRGIGQSQAKRPPRSLGDYSADIVELLDELQLDRVHVLGLSLGGIIAQRVAVDHPGRVNRLVLVSCTDRFSPYLQQTAQLLGHALRRFSWESFVRMSEMLGSSPEYFDRENATVEQRIRAKCAAPVDRRGVACQLRCVARSEMEPSHYRILAPTLVIAGQDDRLIPSCFAQSMAAKIPHSQFVLLPNIGHNPFQECPHEVQARIVEFLNQRDPGAAQSDSQSDRRRTEQCI
jgi:pimeloyl-ACP methyl ester carboxylesterase